VSSERSTNALAIMSEFEVGKHELTSWGSREPMMQCRCGHVVTGETWDEVKRVFYTHRKQNEKSPTDR
jgi:hypothetical protein